MYDFPGVTVVDGREHLLNDVGCVLLAEVLLLGNTLKQFSSSAKLSHQEVSFMILEEFVQLKDVWMVHLFQNTNLSQQLLFLVFF